MIITTCHLCLLFQNPLYSQKHCQKSLATYKCHIVSKLYLPSGRAEFFDSVLVVLKLLEFSSVTSSDEGGSKKSVGSLPQNEPNNTLGHTLEILK